MRASSPARAESSMIGTSAKPGSRRSAAASSSPRSPGIITSANTRSGLRRRDRPAVQANELLHQRQADAAAFVRTAPLALDTVESLEDAQQIGRRDAGAGVADPQLGPAVRGYGQAHRDAALEGELDGVGE